MNSENESKHARTDAEGPETDREYLNALRKVAELDATVRELQRDKDEMGRLYKAALELQKDQEERELFYKATVEAAMLKSREWQRECEDAQAAKEKVFHDSLRILQAIRLAEDTLIRALMGGDGQKNGD